MKPCFYIAGCETVFITFVDYSWPQLTSDDIRGSNTTPEQLTSDDIRGSKTTPEQSEGGNLFALCI